MLHYFDYGMFFGAVPTWIVYSLKGELWTMGKHESQDIIGENQENTRGTPGVYPKL